MIYEGKLVLFHLRFEEAELCVSHSVCQEQECGACEPELTCVGRGRDERGIGND